MKFKDVSWIVVDIEGTISPIEFVRNKMFPYSRKKLESFLSENKNESKVKDCVEQALLAAKSADLNQFNKENVHELFARWIDEDRKEASLKTLQGLIWKEGFEQGDLVSPLFDDAYDKLKVWADVFKLAVYSSGSVAAQQLFFSYSDKGNVLELFDHHFDLAMGSKKESQSYKKIRKVLEVHESSQILFLSDVPEELDAAKEMGWQVGHIVRPGTQSIDRYQALSDFSQIEVSSSGS